MNPTLGDADEILARRNVATLALHGVADMLTVDEIATAIKLLLIQATDDGATNITKTN